MRFVLSPVNSSKGLLVVKMSENLTENHSCSSEQSSREKTPKVSVIVPVYKVEKYLPECIDSILAQTFTDFELILVDDGSPDNSGKICDDYAARDSRIRVFHKENGGVSSARNLGLDNVRGAWIAFVDSDDTVGEKYLEHLWGGNINSPGPEPETLVVSGLTYLDIKGNKVLSLRFRAYKGFVQESFRAENLYRYGYPFAKLYEAKVLARACICFDPKISMAEDLLFMMDYLCFSRGIVFRDAFEDYRYRTVPNSLGRRYSSFEAEFDLFFKMRSGFEKLGISVLNLSERRSLKGYFFRAISCLYRPPIVFPRLEKLRVAFSELSGNEFGLESCTWRERLFLKKHFRCFDLVSWLFYRSYYIVPSWVLKCVWYIYQAYFKRILLRLKCNYLKRLSSPSDLEGA